MCCSWRGMRRRQRCLQQQGKAMGRNSDAFVADQRRSKPWPQKPGQGQQSKGRGKRPIVTTPAGPPPGKTGCEAAQGGESWGPEQRLSWGSPSSLIQTVPNAPHPWALYSSVYLTAAGPCSSYRLGGKKDKKKDGLCPYYLRAWGGKSEPAARSAVTPTAAEQDKRCDAPALTSRPYEEIERKRDI